MNNLIIADTGPVIALATINRLDIFRELSKQVCVPKTVVRELLAKVGKEADIIDAALSSFMVSCDKPEQADHDNINPIIKALGSGERDVIAKAYYSKKQTIVVIDDKAARTIAKKLQLNVTGTIGILLKAKERNLLKDDFADSLYSIRKNGYYLSDRIIELACKIASEKE